MTPVEAAKSAKPRTSSVRRPLSWGLALSVALVGCEEHSSPSANQTAEAPTVQKASTAGAGKSRALTIYGYNYTNRYIDQFYVDGQGGGNLDVSGPGSGGGGSVCCIGWRDGTRLPQTVHIRWVAGGCLHTVVNSSGESREAVRHVFREKDVILSGPVPADPGYFEVHFYPDEHIEVAITTLPSHPRLQLDPARSADPSPEKCKGEE